MSSFCEDELKLGRKQKSLHTCAIFFGPWIFEYVIEEDQLKIKSRLW